MSELRIEDPGLPADYLPTRLARLHRRGDVVRKYKGVATELYDSLVSDVRAGRKRAALVHFRPFADYCLNCLFVAYPASGNELDRRKVPKDLIVAAKRIIEHWKIPVNSASLKKLEGTYHDLSQDTHGSRKALESFEQMRADLIPSLQKLAGMMLGWVEEADRRLNGHRRGPGIQASMRRTGASG
jgi:hypothetical protein